MNKIGNFKDTDGNNLLGLNFASNIITKDGQSVDDALDKKVDKETGKGLSSNDYTDEEKSKLQGLSNYDDTIIKNELANKVDKINGKGLSSNDYTDEDYQKVQSSISYNSITEHNESTSSHLGSIWNPIMLNTEDLNDLIIPGVYYQPRVNTASIDLNYPLKTAGSLEIIKTTGSNTGVNQIYRTYNNGSQEVYTFIRGYYKTSTGEASWSAWKKIIDEEDLNSTIGDINSILDKINGEVI